MTRTRVKRSTYKANCEYSKRALQDATALSCRLQRKRQVPAALYGPLPLPLAVEWKDYTPIGGLLTVLTALLYLQTVASFMGVFYISVQCFRLCRRSLAAIPEIVTVFGEAESEQLWRNPSQGRDAWEGLLI